MFNAIWFLGITLANDPNPQFGATSGPRAKKIDTSLERVLGAFQQDDDRASLDRFALLGFGRYNPRNLDVIKYPYKRGHVYSAMILNLELLKDKQVYYDPDIHIWEDIEFNERVTTAGLVICKVQRYMQKKKQMNHGGCNGNIARPDPVPVPVPDPGPLSPKDLTRQSSAAEVKAHLQSKGWYNDEAEGMTGDDIFNLAKETMVWLFREAQPKSMGKFVALAFYDHLHKDD